MPGRAGLRPGCIGLLEHLLGFLALQKGYGLLGLLLRELHFRRRKRLDIRLG